MSSGTYLADMYAGDTWGDIDEFDHVLPDVNRNLGKQPHRLPGRNRQVTKAGNRVGRVVKPVNKTVQVVRFG